MIDNSENLNIDGDTLVVAVNFKMEDLKFSKKNDFFVAHTIMNIHIVEENKLKDNHSDIDVENALTTTRAVLKLTFNADISLDEINEDSTTRKKLEKEISDVLEPHYRELITTIYSKSQLEVPPLPYGILRK